MLSWKGRKEKLMETLDTVVLLDEKLELFWDRLCTVEEPDCLRLWRNRILAWCYTRISFDVNKEGCTEMEYVVPGNFSDILNQVNFPSMFSNRVNFSVLADHLSFHMLFQENNDGMIFVKGDSMVYYGFDAMGLN